MHGVVSNMRARILDLGVCSVFEAIFPGGELILQFLLLLVFPVAFACIVALGERIYGLELLVLGLPLILSGFFVEFRVLNRNSLLLDSIVDTGQEILVVAQDEPGNALQGGLAQALRVFFPVLFEHLQATALALLGSNQLAQFAGRLVRPGLHQFEEGLECKRLGHLACGLGGAVPSGLRGATTETCIRLDAKQRQSTFVGKFRFWPKYPAYRSIRPANSLRHG